MAVYFYYLLRRRWIEVELQMAVAERRGAAARVASAASGLTPDDAASSQDLLLQPG